MYAVELVETARRFYEAADPPLQRRLDRCFEALRRDPRRHNNIKPLHGRLAGLWRFRVGDYRVVYRIEENWRRVVVLLIAHRREVYE